MEQQEGFEIFNHQDNIVWLPGVRTYHTLSKHKGGEAGEVRPNREQAVKGGRNKEVDKRR